MNVNMSLFGPLSEFKDLVAVWSNSNPFVIASCSKAIE